MEVRHAKRVKDGASVVIKVRMKSCSFVNKDEENEWRSSTEMILNLPKSENIAQLHEVVEDAHAYYVVMEKVEGMDLFELLDSEGRISIAECRAILRKLLQAVQALHAKGCIHKDLKLENVMVDKSPTGCSPKSTKSGKHRFGSLSSRESLGGRGHSTATIREESPEPTVKLIDFDTVEEFSPTVRAKSVVGTDQYIAQEAYAGHYSFASDIFSVGVIAYRLISGRFPFKNQMFDDEPGENWVGSPKMKVIQDRLKHFNIDWNIAPWPSETSARDLVRWMLQMNEKDRPTANDALKHVFLMHTGETPLLPQGPFGSRPKRNSHSNSSLNSSSSP
jgi:serine/threonine protein kinase